MAFDMKELEQLLGYSFTTPALLLQAVTHPSFQHEAAHSSGDHYQRLEFLGDAVLGLLLAELISDTYPGWQEGALSQLRARLAGQDTLAERARSMGIGRFIRLGRGELQGNGREKDSILADVFEAILAAVYCDGGLEPARTLISGLFRSLVASPATLVLGHDAKSEFQEYLSLHNFPPPLYRLIEEDGPPHERRFTFELLLGETVISTGCGKSKKIAQQAAASTALSLLHKRAVS